MPAYDYVCTDCGRTEERRHAIGVDPGACRCGGALSKRFSPPAVVLTGSGFHKTDYR